MLSFVAPLLVYIAGIFAAIVSFSRPKIGVFFLVPLLPFHNVLYRMHGFPLGKDFIDIMFFCILVGWLRTIRDERGRIFTPSPLNKYAWGLIVLTAIGFFVGASLWGLDMTLSLSNARLIELKNFVLLPLLGLIVLNLIQTDKEVRLLVALLIVGLFLADCHYALAMRYKSLAAFHWTRKISGILLIVGGNELAAFYSHFIYIAIGLGLFLRQKILRLALLGLAVFTVYPILFLFSRGGYVAMLLGLAYVGVRRKPIILVGLFVLVLAWTTLLPPAVVERVKMTDAGTGEIDHSSAARFELWQECLEQFLRSPLFGVGYKTFRVYGSRGDPHNAYLEILAEQGLAGILIFVGLLFFAFRHGEFLLRRGPDPFHRGLGLGVAAMAIAVASTNLFGDRWSYVPLSAWLWAFVALAARSRQLIEAGELAAAQPQDAPLEVASGPPVAPAGAAG